MLLLLWAKFIDLFEKILIEKLFKFALLLSSSVFLTVSIINNNKITELSGKIDDIPALINRQDSALEHRFDNKFARMYADNSAILEMYATSSKEDLTRIINYSVTIKDNAELLKALIEKTSAETIKEIRKQQIKQRYHKPDTLNFDITPLSSIDNPFKSLFSYAWTR